MSSEVFPPHSGIWTIGDLAQIDDEAHRYEIVDGALVVSPPSAVGHQFVTSQISDLLKVAFGPDHFVFENVGLDLAPTLRIPDLTVFRRSATTPAARSVLPADVALVVEVVSPSSATTDRITKLAEYAMAGIGAYWRIETDPVFLTVYALPDGVSTYVEVGTWTEGEVADLTHPVDLRVTIDDLRLI